MTDTIETETETEIVDDMMIVIEIVKNTTDMRETETETEIVDDMTSATENVTDMTGIVTDTQDEITLQHQSPIVDMKIATLPILHLEEVPDANLHFSFRIERETPSQI
jgi:hypothetical protein